MDLTGFLELKKDITNLVEMDLLHIKTASELYNRLNPDKTDLTTFIQSEYINRMELFYKEFYHFLARDSGLDTSKSHQSEDLVYEKEKLTSKLESLKTLPCGSEESYEDDEINEVEKDKAIDIVEKIKGIKRESRDIKQEIEEEEKKKKKVIQGLRIKHDKTIARIEEKHKINEIRIRERYKRKKKKKKKKKEKEKEKKALEN